MNSRVHSVIGEYQVMLPAKHIGGQSYSVKVVAVADDHYIYHTETATRPGDVLALAIAWCKAQSEQK